MCSKFCHTPHTVTIRRAAIFRLCLFDRELHVLYEPTDLHASNEDVPCLAPDRKEPCVGILDWGFVQPESFLSRHVEGL